MAKYEALTHITLDTNTSFIHPGTLPELVHADDDASSVMVDFNKRPLFMIYPDQSIDIALQELKHHGIHMLLVVDKERRVHGLIATEDLLGEKPIKHMQERRLKHDEVLVKMVMQPIDQLLAIDKHELRNAKVGHVIMTLKEARQHYALVVDTNGDLPKVCGLFSSFQISKQLHADVNSALLGSVSSIAKLDKLIPKD